MQKNKDSLWLIVLLILLFAAIYYIARKNNLRNELKKRLIIEEEKLKKILEKLKYNEEELNKIYNKIDKEVRIWRLIVVSIYLIINAILIWVFNFDLISVFTWNTIIWSIILILVFAFKGKIEDINLINEILNKYIRRKYLKKISEHDANIRKLSIEKYIQESEVKKINDKLDNLD